MGRTTLLLGGLTAMLICCNVAEAQRRTPGFRGRPAISPYVQLFQGSNAGLNSYFGMVRPRVDVEQQLMSNANEFLYQQQQMDQRSLQLQQELEDTLSQGTSTLQTRPTTGSGAVRRPAGAFMNYSTYFRGAATSAGTGSSIGRTRIPSR
jgi:hypothetical protein